ncbi:hypothetical protein ACSBR2_032497 [Camellia fascicularis]
MLKQEGWIQVIKQRGRQVNHSTWIEDRRSRLFTLFVDNLPESMEPRHLHDLFIKFAKVAEQKAHGLWVDDKSLALKLVEYSKGIVPRQQMQPPPPRKIEARNTFAMAA